MTFDEFKNRAKSGMSFTAIFRGDNGKWTGRVSVEHGGYFLCQNLHRGNICDDTQGFHYSWVVNTDNWHEFSNFAFAGHYKDPRKLTYTIKGYFKREGVTI